MRWLVAVALAGCIGCHFVGLTDDKDNDEPKDAAVEVDSSPPDASPDAPVDADDGCGDTGEMCCAQNKCDPFHDCNSNTCEQCGGTLQGCCDTGPRCMGLLTCVLGQCTL